MSLSEVSNSIQMINDEFNANVANAQAEMIQAQNNAAACALDDQTRVDEGEAQLNQAKAEAKGKPMTDALQAMGPGLSEAVSKGINASNGGKKQAQDSLNAKIKQLETTWRQFKLNYMDNDAKVESFLRPNTNELNENYNEAQRTFFSSGPVAFCSRRSRTSSVETPSPETPEEAYDKKLQCQEDFRRAQYLFQEAEVSIPRLKEEIKQGGIFNSEMMLTLFSGGITYFGSNRSSKASLAAAEQQQNATKKNSAAARALCERNAKFAEDTARRKIADLNARKKRALDNLALASSQPLPLGDETDVPVDEVTPPLGGLPVVGSAESYANSKENPPAATPSGAGASGGGGGASSGGGGSDAGSPNWSFNDQGGGFPGGNGLPAATMGGKFAAIDGGGAGGGGGFGGGFSDPFGALGMNEDEEESGSRALAGLHDSGLSGDGGLNLMLVRARYRYGAHAAELLRKIDLKQMAKNSEEIRNRAPAMKNNSKNEVRVERN